MTLEGAVKHTMELPAAFSERVRPELIRRAVLAENSLRLQPQAHYVLAGMQTSAAYFGARGAYRTGRHMGVAIRPREKLGGGVQGKVKRIPSATKGRRAHPHQVGKIIVERINTKEYRKALASAVSATASSVANLGIQPPLVMTDEIELLKKTKEVLNVFSNMRLLDYINSGPGPNIRKGIRGSSRIKIYKKRLLLVVGKDSSVIRAARNIPGVDVCEVGRITANLLAPGGVPGRLTVWSESAAANVGKAIENSKVS